MGTLVLAVADERPDSCRGPFAGADDLLTL